MPRVFVLGNVTLDVSLQVPRLPLPGETLIATGLTRAPGGKGLNQAVVACRSGVDVHFCAPLGRDPEGAMMHAALLAEGFSGLCLPEVAGPTDFSALMVVPDGENCIVSTGACAEMLSEADALGFVAGMAADDLLVVQGNLPLATTLAAVTRHPRALFNTAPLRWPAAAVAGHSDIVVANRVEAEQVTGCAAPAEAVLRLGGRVGIVTLGADGCLVAVGGGIQHLPAVAVAAPCDTTGAGDSFCGALAAGLARGLDLAPAIAVAQRAAALVVQRPGCFASLPTAADWASLWEAC